MIVCELQREHSLRWRPLRKNQPDAALVRDRFSTRGVMHLENQIGTGGNKFRHRRRPLVRRTSRSVHQQNVTVRPVRSAAILLVLQRRSGKRFPCRRMAQPVRIRRPYVHHRVMHIGPRRWQHLRHLHPAVLSEVCRHNFVGVIHIPCRRQRHRLRHLHH